MLNRPLDFSRQRWRVVLLHALAWVAYLFFNNFLLIRSGEYYVSLPRMVFTYSLVAVLFYVNVYGIVRPNVSKRRYGRLAWQTLLLIATYGLVRYALYYFFFPLLGISSDYAAYTVMLRDFYLDSLWLVLQYLLLSYGYWFAIHSVAVERNRRLLELNVARLENEKVRAELAFLRAQLNPHFLYNTLNFLFADALKTSPRLAESILMLASMLRAISNLGEQEQVPVARELDYVQNYVALQRLRFGAGLHLRLLVEGRDWADTLFMPPLTLITLVENVFKYGDLADPAAPARIEVWLGPGEVVFQTNNRKKTEPTAEQTGLGLSNVVNQLELLHRGRYLLEKQEDSEYFALKLRIRSAPLPPHP